MDDARLLIVADEMSQADDIKSRVTGLIPTNLSLYPDEVRREVVRLEPDIVILQEPKDDTGLQLLHYIKNELPDTIIIYLTEHREPIRTRDLNRAGAFDILFLPDEVTALPDVSSRALKALELRHKAKEDASSGFTWGRGQVISFYSGKGGSGNTLIAATLGQTLQLDSNSSVLLVDMNLQYGGLETILGLEPERSIHDLTPVLKELNDNHIRNVTAIEPSSQMEVLISPVSVEIAEQVTEEHIQRLLRAARLYYDYIIVDLPTQMTSLVYTALEESDRIYYVINPDAVSIRMCNRVLQLFGILGVDTTDRMELIVNKLNRDSEFPSKDLKQRFDFPVCAQIREDNKKVHHYINRGVPLRKSRRDSKNTNFSKDIKKMADWLLKMNTKKAED